MHFPGGSDGKESTCNAGDAGLIPGLGGSPGEENGHPLQYSCLENPHGWRSLVGYSLQDHKESDMIEQLLEASVRHSARGKGGLCEENLAKNSHSCHLPRPLTLRSTHSHRGVPKQAQISSKACSLKFKVRLLWYIHAECRHCYGNGQGQGSLAGGSTVLETLY